MTLLSGVFVQLVPEIRSEISVKVHDINYTYVTYQEIATEGILGTVVARWAAGQQVEQSILRQGMIHNKIHHMRPGCFWPSIALTVQNRGLKHHSLMYSFIQEITYMCTVDFIYTN